MFLQAGEIAFNGIANVGQGFFASFPLRVTAWKAWAAHHKSPCLYVGFQDDTVFHFVPLLHRPQPTAEFVSQEAICHRCFLYALSVSAVKLRVL